MPDSQRLVQHIEQAWRGSPIWFCTFKHWQLKRLAKTMKNAIIMHGFTHRQTKYTPAQVYISRWLRREHHDRNNP